MNIAIVWTAFYRVEYLQQTMDSWSCVRGLDEVKKYMFLEPSPRKDEMLQIVKDSGIDIEVHENETLQGVLHNPWVAMEYAFNEGADFVILAEDDLIVSTD